jgi:trimeric autotransporter adhesin
MERLNNLRKVKNVTGEEKILVQTNIPAKPFEYIHLNQISPSLKTLNGESLIGSGDVTTYTGPTFDESFNVSYGPNSLGQIDSNAYYNTSIGFGATDSGTPFTDNVGIGFISLRYNSTSYNTAIGSSSMRDTTTGDSNTALGYNSLTNNTAGRRNVAIGVYASFHNTTGNYNVAVGDNSLYYTSTGNSNIGIGSGSLYTNDSGSLNVAIGKDALSSTTSAHSNTTIGYSGLLDLESGNYNTAIGRGAGTGLVTGSSNTLIGFAARVLDTHSGCVVLGASASATASNQFVVGSSGVNAGAVATESLTPTKSWTVKINGVDYKIPLQVA